MEDISRLELAALVWLLACWAGYGLFLEHGRHRDRGLVGTSHQYRLAWAEQLLLRENRIVDSALLGNLMQSVSFYANTSIYIIAGLLAVFGGMDHLLAAVADVPLLGETSRRGWELRLLLMVAIFVVAYFKFTWSLRQFNLLSILIGAAPTAQAPAAQRARYAERMAALNTGAGDDFNRGIRAYYFGLAAVCGSLHPLMLVAMSLVVVAVLYHRDFHSAILHALRDD